MLQITSGLSVTSFLSTKANKNDWIQEMRGKNSTNSTGDAFVKIYNLSKDQRSNNLAKPQNWAKVSQSGFSYSKSQNSLYSSTKKFY